MHALGDDDIFVANHEVSPSRTNIVMTSGNMLKHLKYENLVLAVDSSYKINFNGYPVHILACVDKQQRFHPTAYSFSSQEDQQSCSFFFEFRQSCMQKFMKN